MKIKTLLACSCFLAAVFVTQASATTIDFIDLTDETVTVNITLTGGVTLVSSTASSESANVVFLEPKGLFTFPAGVTSVGALAALLEPPGESEAGSGSISDLVTLSVSPGAAGTNVDGVSISFRSDTTGLNLSPVPNAIMEDGTLQLMNGAFTIPNPEIGGPRLPYTLPAGFSISVQSDVVPEPSTIWMTLPGIASLIATVKRMRAARRC